MYDSSVCYLYDSDTISYCRCIAKDLSGTPYCGYDIYNALGDEYMSCYGFNNLDAAQCAAEQYLRHTAVPAVPYYQLPELSNLSFPSLLKLVAKT